MKRQMICFKSFHNFKNVNEWPKRMTYSNIKQEETLGYKTSRISLVEKPVYLLLQISVITDISMTGSRTVAGTDQKIQ